MRVEITVEELKVLEDGLATLAGLAEIWRARAEELADRPPPGTEG